MSSEKRRYEQRKRAEDVAATRRRITEAAMALHGTVGPAQTTISAVADRAGVQRHTVYRHFPTDLDLFAACSAHFATQHPSPDLSRWAAIEDPDERLRVGLTELYAWYERTGTMWENVYRDEPVVAAIGPALQPLRDYFDEAI